MVSLRDAKYSGFPGYKELSVDFSKINTSIEVKEGVIKKYDKFIVIFMVTDKIDDLWKPEEFKPSEPVLLVIHTSTYERWTKDNPKTPTEPSELELAIAEWANDSGWLNKPFQGELMLMAALAKTLKKKIPGVSILNEPEELEGLSVLKNIPSPSSSQAGGGGKQIKMSPMDKDDAMREFYRRFMNDKDGMLCEGEESGAKMLGHHMMCLKKSDPDFYEEMRFLIDLMFR
ncbi:MULTISPECIES: hypothetical protein [Aerosakkonema]|uniref:hypothetical protein n=1 Tax=Aerosakkonema TaxID=1246629 RepID=UPI0035BB5AF4